VRHLGPLHVGEQRRGGGCRLGQSAEVDTAHGGLALSLNRIGEHGVGRDACTPFDALGLGVGVWGYPVGGGKANPGRLAGVRLQGRGYGCVKVITHLRANFMFQ
jgi:hypothetical protein